MLLLGFMEAEEVAPDCISCSSAISACQKSRRPFGSQEGVWEVSR